MVRERSFILPTADRKPPYSCILVDFKFWSEHSVELHEWCEKNLHYGAKAFEGSVVVLHSEQEVMLFELRWG